MAVIEFYVQSMCDDKNLSSHIAGFTLCFS
jgi:hypothetical protein